MNAVVVVLLLMGGFLVMDAVGEQRVLRARKESRKRPGRAARSLYEEQLSGRSLRDEFADMFESSGPWMFRDDFAGLPVGGDKAPPLGGGAAAGGKSFEQRLSEEISRRQGVAADDPVAEAFSGVPKTPAERVRRRRERREARGSSP